MKYITRVRNGRPVIYYYYATYDDGAARMRRE